MRSVSFTAPAYEAAIGQRHAMTQANTPEPQGTRSRLGIAVAERVERDAVALRPPVDLLAVLVEVLGDARDVAVHLREHRGELLGGRSPGAAIESATGTGGERGGGEPRAEPPRDRGRQVIDGPSSVSRAASRARISAAASTRSSSRTLPGQSWSTSASAASADSGGAAAPREEPAAIATMSSRRVAQRRDRDAASRTAG